MLSAFVLCCFVKFTQGRNYSSLISSRDSGHGWGWTASSSSYGLQSFFDIALTALAFLSFGIFLLNLLLNALMFTGASGGLTATGPIITNTGQPTGGVDTGGGATEAPLFGSGYGGYSGKSGTLGRYRRSVFDLYVDPVSSIDSLAHSVLTSIDAMVEEHECVKKVLCEGNRKARIVGRGFEYLMPVYSFGASFIGEKFGLHSKLPDHMDAILLGVDESNCQSHFPQC